MIESLKDLKIQGSNLASVALALKAGAKVQLFLSYARLPAKKNYAFCFALDASKIGVPFFVPA